MRTPRLAREIVCGLCLTALLGCPEKEIDTRDTVSLPKKEIPEELLLVSTPYPGPLTFSIGEKTVNAGVDTRTMVYTFRIHGPDGLETKVEVQGILLNGGAVRLSDGSAYVIGPNGARGIVPADARPDYVELPPGK